MLGERSVAGALVMRETISTSKLIISRPDLLNKQNAQNVGVSTWSLRVCEKMTQPEQAGPKRLLLTEKFGLYY